MQFKITGSPIRNRAWKCIHNFIQRRVKATDDKTVNVKKVFFPTPYSLIIRYEILNLTEKFQICIQGDFEDRYRIANAAEGDPLSGLPEDEVRAVIKANHPSSKNTYTISK